MKKILFIIGLMPFLSNAQDVITLKNGDEINSKIIEVGTEEIKYKKGDRSPTYVIKKSDVFMIKYEDGAKDLFNTPIIVNAEKSNKTDNLYLKGKGDASKYYEGTNCGEGGVIVATLVLSPLIGIIPTAICASTPPRSANLNIPNKELLNNQEYMTGYSDAAHEIKRRKIWTAWGISTGINFLILLTIYAQHQ